MAADATTILAAVAGVLKALYPDVPVYTSKQSATDGGNGEAGFQEGFTAPAFVLSCREAEDVDRVSPSFQYLTVGYSVAIQFIKPVNAAIADAPNSGMPSVVEDPEIRDKRAGVRAALFKVPLSGAPAVFHVTYRPGRVYERTGQGGAKYVLTSQTLTYFTTEPRPH